MFLFIVYKNINGWLHKFEKKEMLNSQHLFFHPDVLDMLSRREFLVDDELEALFPAQRLCRIEICTKDGKTYASERYRPDGEACDHVDMEWEEKKFRRITAPLMTAEQQTEILELLRGDLDVPMYDIVQKINRIMIPIRDRIM